MRIPGFKKRFWSSPAVEMHNSVIMQVPWELVGYTVLLMMWRRAAWVAPCREAGHGQEQRRAAMDKPWGLEQAGVAKPETLFPGLGEVVASLFYRWETETQ